MAAVLKSFAELANVLSGNVVKKAKKVKVKKVAMLADCEKISAKCGEKAAVVWSFLQDQEACKRYGAKGEILHDVANLKAVTGYDEETIFGIVVALVSNGFARMTANGQYVRAA